MKKTMMERLREFCASLLPVLKRYPVEMALMVFTFVILILSRQEVVESEQLANLLLVPLFFTLAFVLNTRIPRESRARWFYNLSWLPIVPLWLSGVAVLWVESREYWITLGVLCPLAVLMCRRAVENRTFVGDTLAYIAAAVLSQFFVTVAWGLFLAISFSIVYIFHILEGSTECVLFYSGLTSALLLQPLLFFAMLERVLALKIDGVRLLDILLNWIITPALLIYTGVLYLYALKITVTWTLPEGKVAYMVFGFTMLAIVVKALRLMALKPSCEWFFSRFSLIALPPLALFWVGTLCRVGEYGLTEPRVWLVICGLLMTVCIGLFLTQRLGRYLYFCSVAFVVLTAVCYLPWFHPQRIALRAQEARVERLANRLGLIGSTGRMVGRVESIDSAEYKTYHHLYESVDYLYWKDDTVALRRILGISEASELLDRLPEEAVYYIRNGDFGDEYDSYDYDRSNYIWLGPDRSMNVDLTKGFKKLYLVYGYGEEATCDYERDSLIVSIPGREWRIASDEFVRHQLRTAGCPEGAWPTEQTLHQLENKLLRYETGEILVLFNHVSFQADSLGVLRLDGLDGAAILTK